MGTGEGFTQGREAAGSERATGRAAPGDQSGREEMGAG